MVQVKALHVFLCVMGLLSETLCSLSLEAEVGDKVTIWCQHELSLTGYIFWFKHTSDSVPLLIGCKKTLSQLVACHFFTESERIVMSVHDKNTSLTITAVNVSDTGLYYCGYMELHQVNFSNSTLLHVKEESIEFPEGKEPGCVWSAVFFMLTSFGSATVILFCVLIFIVLKLYKKVNTGAAAEDNEAAESDSVYYAAQQVSKMKTRRTKRHDEKVYTRVIYSSLDQSNVCS